MRGSIQEMLEAFKSRISELSQNTIQSAEDIDRQSDASDDYIYALHECVTQHLNSAVESCLVDKDDDNIYFIVTSGSDVQEFKVPNSDISWAIDKVEEDADYICEAIDNELGTEERTSVTSAYVASANVIDHRITSKDWKELISMIEDATGLYVDAPDYYDQWIQLVDWDDHVTYDVEVTKYSDGTYEVVPGNVSSPLHDNSEISGSESIEGAITSKDDIQEVYDYLESVISICGDVIDNHSDEGKCWTALNKSCELMQNALKQLQKALR